MKMFNIFYVVVGLLGVLLYILLKPDNNAPLSFYGFAETNDTEINYNYPVVIDRIRVQQGQNVAAGDTLMHISRRKSRELLEDQRFKINELNAEEAIWRQKKQNELASLNQEMDQALAEKQRKIKKVESELKFKKSLAEDLTTVDPENSQYNPLEEALDELKEEVVEIRDAYQLKIDAAEQELTLGDNPYQEQRRRLMAEMEFEEDQQVQHIVVVAPTDGLIGNISCKEEEHIPSYKTLLTFYEPHPGLIKGFVHEDLTLAVNIGDRCQVSSIKDETIQYPGVVVGLGSRIVEIPSRLRKVPDIKTYGREVLIEINPDNQFLQKEKVGISFTKEGT